MTRKIQRKPKVTIIGDKTVSFTKAYRELAQGQLFLYKEDLYIKADIYDQEGLRLKDGHVEDSMCDEQVVPVDVVITWSYI